MSLPVSPLVAKPGAGLLLFYFIVIYNSVVVAFIYIEGCLNIVNHTMYHPKNVPNENT